MAYRTYIVSIPHACIVIKAVDLKQARAEAQRHLFLEIGDAETEILEVRELIFGAPLLVEYLNEDIREI